MAQVCEAALRRLWEPSAFPGNSAGKGLVNTKAGLSSAFQTETLTLALRTGLPWQMPQKLDWWPPGWLEPESAGEGSRPRIMSESGQLQLGTTRITDLNTGWLRSLVCEDPPEQKHCIFPPIRPRQGEA